MSKNDDTMPVTFPEKWAKIVSKMPEFKDTADSSSTEELREIIVQCEGNIYTTEKEMEANVKLSAAKELVATYKEPYNEAMKTQKAKIQYALFLLESKGENLDNTTEEDET